MNMLSAEEREWINEQKNNNKDIILMNIDGVISQEIHNNEEEILKE